MPFMGNEDMRLMRRCRFLCPLDLLIVFAVAIVIGGCGSTVTASNVRSAPSDFVVGDAFTVLLQRGVSQVSLGTDEFDRLERDIGQCIDRGLQTKGVNLSFMPPQQFRRLVFPDIPTGSIQGVPWREMTDDLSSPSQLAASGVRYVIAVTVAYVRMWRTDSFRESGLAAGGGVYKSRHARMQAEVFDVRHGRSVGVVTATADGLSGAGVMFISMLPVPIFDLSFPESSACQRLAAETAVLLIGR
jgi:hypothetical protein